MKWLKHWFEKTPDPLDSVTPRVQRLFVHARKQADRLHHGYVGTEHLLLGLLEMKEGVGFAALNALAVDLDALRIKLEAHVSPGKSENDGRSIPYTPAFKKALKLGAKEATAMGLNYLGTEHVLLGLLRLRCGIAPRALKALKVEIGPAREAVKTVLSSPPEKEAERSVEAPPPVPPSDTPLP